MSGKILVVGPSGSGLSAALRIVSEKNLPILIVDDNHIARQQEIIAQSIAKNLLKRQHDELLSELVRHTTRIDSVQAKIISDSKAKQAAKAARRAKRFK